MKFKKITAIAGSLLMTGLTIAAASAAAFPAPFVKSGTADVAIVYGANADLVASNNVHTALGKFVTSTGAMSVTGGESFKLEKSSDKFNFQDGLDAVYTSLDKDEMSFLADGTYDDGDVDEDYEQSITLGSQTLELFTDNDYNNDAPTVGFHWTNADPVLNYTLDLDNEVLFSDMVETDMPLLGASYYVLAASATQIDILDSAESQMLAQGETVTVTLDGEAYTLSVDVYSDFTAKFTVNGEFSEKLSEGGYDEVSTDVYVVAKEINYAAKETGISDVQFALGKGKIELIDGNEAELNGDKIDGLEVALTEGNNASYFETATLMWKSDRDTFLTEDDSLMMPGFEKISLSFGGLNMPSDSEIISVDNGETMTLSMDNYDLPFVWYNGTAAILGEEDAVLVTNTSTLDNNTWTSPARTENSTGGLALVEGNRFIVTNLGTDLTDVETMYYEVTTVENDTDILVELEDLIGTNDLTFDKLEANDRGVVTATLDAINGTVAGATAYITFSTTSNTIYHNKVVSDKGMVITLPALTDGVISDIDAGFPLNFSEADKDDDLTQGREFFATISNTTNERLHVSTHNLTAYDEEESTDNFIGYVPSNLASKLTFDTSADENDFSIEYFGEEVMADVYVVVGDATMTTATADEFLPVKASEIDNVKSKNLVIVGGSCVNTAAATLLGGSLCGEDFTAATGVGNGQFVIEEYMDVFATGKTALLVAGYEQADTVNAVTYLTQMEDVDTSEKMVMGLESVIGLG
jgi:hypothetical protein